MLKQYTAPARATWREWLGLALLTIPLFMMATDITVLFLAMPSLTADLTPSTTQMLWILHVGEFVAAGLVITFGRLTDKVGRRRLLMIAMLLYGISSALAAFASTPELLILARVLIGAATAAASPAAITLLRSMFADPRQFGIAFAVLMGSFSVGAALGPPMGGVLLEHFWWGSVFLMNVPAAALLLLGGRWLLPTYRDPSGGGVDAISVGLSIIAVIAVIFGLQEIADRGVSLPYLAAIVAGLALGAVFIHRQRRLADPLLDLSLFAHRALAVSAAVLVGTGLAFMAVDMMLVQYLQVVAQVSMTTLGLLLSLPGVAAIVGTMLAPVAARMMRPGPAIAVALVISALGAAMIPAAIAFAGGDLPWLITGASVIGLGTAPVFVIAAQLVVTSAPPRQAGSATAVQDISAGLGGATGMALVGSAAMVVFARVLRDQAPAQIGEVDLDAAAQSVGGALAAADSLGGVSGQRMSAAVQSALTTGTQAAYLIAVVVALGVIALTLLGLRGVELPTGIEHDGEEAPAVDIETDGSGSAQVEQHFARARSGVGSEVEGGGGLVDAEGVSQQRLDVDPLLQQSDGVGDLVDETVGTAVVDFAGDEIGQRSG